MSVGFQYLKIPYGENILALLGSECLKVYEQSEEGKTNYKKHIHNLMEIAICRMGSGEVIIDENRYTYKQGDVIVIPRNFSHAIISNSVEKNFWEYIYVKPRSFLEKIDNTEARKKEWMIKEIESRAFIKSKEDVPTLFSEINLIMDQCRRREYEFAKSVGGLIYALFIEIIRINHKEYQKPEFDRAVVSQKVEILGMALEYIEENFAKDLRMSDIAQAAFVSETYLRRLFSDCCATSPMHYVKTIKIENACEMLQSGNVSINEVAYKVGYTNMTTFINNFKQITGMTPKQWKQDYRQKKVVKKREIGNLRN